MNFPNSLKKLIDWFKQLPGVGEKTAIRYAFSILKMDQVVLNQAAEVLSGLHSNLETCPNCGCLIEKGNCPYCVKESEVICVVENQKDVFVFEKNGYFNGKYHVLGGLISPMEGINPEDISIDKLINRVEKENINEIILALRPGIEGNTTSLYIKKIMEEKNVKITRIAQGIPIGADIEYLDDLTLEMALENRNEIE